MSIDFKTGKHLVDVLHQYCPRCAMHHYASRDVCGEWVHGTDDIGDGNYAPPEPCQAAAAHELYRRIETKENTNTGASQ